MSGCRITLLHAYSRHNAGDGLLVDLSLRLIREALGERVRVTLVASDPPSFAASFAGCNAVYPAPVIAQQGWRRAWACGASLLSIPTCGTRGLRRLLGASDVIVGVGGGYLRARTMAESLKLRAGHLVQLCAAVESGRPAIYLPQSIGPVAAVHGSMQSRLADTLACQLGALKRVYVRDHRSMQWLAGNANTSRAPDLAILELGRRLTGAETSVQAGQPVRHVAMVLREAPAWSRERREHYQRAIAQLIVLLRRECRVSFAVQSAVRGNDDTRFYRSLRIEPIGSLQELLRTDRPDMVVSVRLHGALESLLAGVPAYHLSYERKGFGAYEDLGLGNWVQNAAAFDPAVVLDTMLARNAAERFQACLMRRAAELNAQRHGMVRSLRDAGSRPAGR